MRNSGRPESDVASGFCAAETPAAASARTATQSIVVFMSLFLDDGFAIYDVFGESQQVGAVENARHRIDALQRLDLAAGRGAELLELARRDEDARLVGPDGVVERFH